MACVAGREHIRSRGMAFRWSASALLSDFGVMALPAPALRGRATGPGSVPSRQPDTAPLGQGATPPMGAVEPRVAAEGLRSAAERDIVRQTTRASDLSQVEPDSSDL